MSWHEKRTRYNGRMVAVKHRKARLKTYQRLSKTSRGRLEELPLYITDKPYDEETGFPEESYRFGSKIVNPKQKAPVAYSQIVHIMKKHPEVITELETQRPRIIEYTSVPPEEDENPKLAGRASNVPAIWVRPVNDVKPGTKDGRLVWKDVRKYTKHGKHEIMTPSAANRTAETFIHELTHVSQVERGDSRKMNEWNQQLPYEERPHEIEARETAAKKVGERLEPGRYPTGEEISNTLNLPGEGDVSIDWGKKDPPSREERINAALKNIHKYDRPAREVVFGKGKIPGIKVVVKSPEVMGDYIALHGRVPNNELPTKLRNKIPKNELWIRSDNYHDKNKTRKAALLAHERYEIYLMKKYGLTYKQAHARAEIRDLWY